ncbi:ABC transporter ATP-binding protein [Arthrobacter sp. NQ7]|uniref:ABC transporter ATP-binding protein n=1 Tax=Arthrobacter sp. NQ7 TaxID=3032303 RepID=UPI00241068E0|nr:ABC transporter ATP-binding protein [Arthrobacter sp. NQ7]MDJ0457991.1 ABC transporter ATP-binding protein [Arthrobacter sp. NQ7]
MRQGLVVQGLSKSFKGAPHPALEEFSLSLAPGSCTAVLGPSGSGKSTLLRTAAGLEIPDRGSVLLEGRDLATVRPERRGMAMVFQRPLLFPHLNVLDNVAFAARIRGVPRRRARADAESFLELVQMQGTGRRAVSGLSGGQQQRVAIARGLAARPAVLLLDEPFSALDPELRSAMHELLSHVREQLNPMVLMVTHDRDEASAVADQLALISEGTLLQHSSVEAMYTRPVSLQVSRLMGGTNEVPGTIRGGVHYSALGAHALPADHPWAEGPATLLIRPERIIVLEDHNPGLPAVITRIRARGPRRLMTVEAAGVTLNAEETTCPHPAPGDTVRLQLPTSALAAVAPQPTAETSALISPTPKVPA